MENNLIEKEQLTTINILGYRTKSLEEEIKKSKKIVDRKKKEWYYPIVLGILGTVLTTFSIAFILGDKMLLQTGIDSSVLWGIPATMNGYTFVATISGTLFTLLCSCYGLADIVTYKKEN